jgi:hypothetical protein
MRTKRRAATAAVVAAGFLLSALVGTACGTRTTAHEYGARARTGAVTIDLSGGARFVPAPAGAKPALTRQQARVKFIKPMQVKTYRSSAIPRAVVSVRLGLLTLPLGPMGELVYEYSSHQCPR